MNAPMNELSIYLYGPLLDALTKWGRLRLYRKTGADLPNMNGTRPRSRTLFHDAFATRIAPSFCGRFAPMSGACAHMSFHDWVAHSPDAVHQNAFDKATHLPMRFMSPLRPEPARHPVGMPKQLF